MLLVLGEEEEKALVLLVLAEEEEQALVLLVLAKDCFLLGSIELVTCGSYPFVPLQFSRVMTSPHTPLTTRSACVFFTKSLTERFSFVQPLCLCLLKKFSRELLLRNDVTPGIVKI